MNIDDSRKVALITGASSGIGMAIAKLHASKGGDLILVARRKERLEALSAELQDLYKTGVYIIAGDLSTEGTPKEIFREIEKNKFQIDYLVNNAGFSKIGYFNELEWKEIRSMMRVNMMSMVELTHFILLGMKLRNHGRILNVASSAAFAPGGPLQTIYYATKAFIVSFSQGLAGELAETGITVTALCPGATATEFEKVSGLDKTPLFSMEKVYTAEEVARDGYEAMLRGDLVKMTALTPMNKFVLRNMNYFPARRVLQQIKMRQERGL
jgi:short-subunit dehydrogenase